MLSQTYQDLPDSRYRPRREPISPATGWAAQHYKLSMTSDKTCKMLTSEGSPTLSRGEQCTRTKHVSRGQFTRISPDSSPAPGHSNLNVDERRGLY